MRHLARALIFVACLAGAALAHKFGANIVAACLILDSGIAPLIIINGKD